MSLVQRSTVWLLMILNVPRSLVAYCKAATWGFVRHDRAFARSELLRERAIYAKVIANVCLQSLVFCWGGVYVTSSANENGMYQKKNLSALFVLQIFPSC